MPQRSNIRPSEQLNWDALADYVRPRLAAELKDKNALAEPMVVEQFRGGHSNLTYLLRFGDLEFVLRRPPLGPVPPKAHDMARECRILSAIHPVFPLAPRPFLLCEDPAVLGATFYIMERRRGIVIRGEEPADLIDNPPLREQTSIAIVDVLADLHSVDIDAHGLRSLGKAEGFVERQVRGWTQRWHGSKTTEQVEMDQLSEWLLQRLPADPARPTLLHGDYKLDNVMFTKTFDRLTAVFDWEMSAIGDPLVDLGIFLAYWTHTTPVTQRGSLNSVTTRPGWFTRDQILDHYQTRTQSDLTNLRFYEVFAVFKLAVVLQQIFYRYFRGQTDDPRFATLDQRVESLAQIAATLAESS